jgi:hypothetical protein
MKGRVDRQVGGSLVVWKVLVKVELVDVVEVEATWSES